MVSARPSLAVLRGHDFRWYFASQTVNVMGTAMAAMALTFAVLQVDRSATALGQVLAARMVPTIAFLLLGGAISDRFPRVTVLQVGNVVSAASQGAAAYLVISGHARIWELALLQVVNGTTTAVTLPAMEGMVPQLVERTDLQAANVLLQQTRSGCQVIGPALSGVLIAVFGPGLGLAIDAATWAIAALMMIPVHTPLSRARTKAGILRDLGEGWRFVRNTQWLWVIVVAFGLINAVQAGAVNTVGPAIAYGTIGSHGWGLARSAQAAGTLLVTFLLLRITLARPLRTAMIVYVVQALPLVVLGLGVRTAPLALAMLLGGAASGVFGLAWSLAMQENVPGDMLSRVYSYDMLGSFVAIPVGQLAYGPLSQAIGDRALELGSAVALVAVCLGALTSPQVRRLRHAGSGGQG